MAVNAVSTSQAAASDGKIVNPSSVLKKDDFLKMFIATLKNQDPVNPVDSKEFLSQNAMFTELEKLSNIEALLTQNQELQQDSGKMLTAAYMGREVAATIPPSKKDEIVTTVSGIVVGINFEGDTPKLLLDNGKSVSIRNLTSVRIPGYSQTTSSVTGATGTTEV